MDFSFLTTPQDGPPSTSSRFFEAIAKMNAPHVVTTRTLTSITADKVHVGGMRLIGSQAYPKSNNIGCLYQYAGYTGVGRSLPISAYIYCSTDKDHNITLEVASEDFDFSKKLTDAILSTLPVPPEVINGTVEVRFWYWTGQGASNDTRELDVPEWSAIEHNYSKDARTAFDKLMKLDTTDIDGGKILLMHGPPGTGKTTAIRALVNAWKPWCNAEYVVDPEVAFGNAAYLVSLLMADYSYDSSKWRLIIIEDAEKFLGEDAKDEASQSVGRLLNLGDGLIGQGLKVLVLLTTNEHIEKLHPAITRPGRCLLNIEVPPLNAEEVSAWTGQPSDESATLAELYERKTETQIGATGPDVPVPGMYL